MTTYSISLLQAVICEDPHLFGFDFECPMESQRGNRNMDEKDTALGLNAAKTVYLDVEFDTPLGRLRVTCC